MSEFLVLLPPAAALERFLSALPESVPAIEIVPTQAALGRILAQDVIALQALPEFARSTVDGYAVLSSSTHGASDSLPAYLTLRGEIRMGEMPEFSLNTGECALIHTGGALPPGADAVVMLENTQQVVVGSGAAGEVEVYRPCASGENVILPGEDVQAGQRVCEPGRRLRPAEIGGCMALGVTQLRVATEPRVGIISSGDELIAPDQAPALGQIRDINSYSLGALVEGAGGTVHAYGIAADDLDSLRRLAAIALSECDMLLITAGSSASSRDYTASAVQSLGEPGVLVHGVNLRPGKPTILAVCQGKAVIGLPGNPVSALVVARLFVLPVIDRLLGRISRDILPQVQAILTINIPSQAGREDWIGVRVYAEDSTLKAEPVFGKSNLIFSLAAATGLVCIPPDSTGLAVGEQVTVFLL
jgi:molybdopterin molybdotransferase